MALLSILKIFFHNLGIIAPIVITLLFALILLASDVITLCLIGGKIIHKDVYLQDKISNYTLIVGTKVPKIFITKKFPNNIFIFQGVFLGPTIVFGNSLKYFLNEREINSLILSAILRLKSNYLYLATVNNLLISICCFPFVLFKKINRFHALDFILNIYLYFIALSKDKIFIDTKMVLKYDQMIAKYSGDLPDFASALFKIYIHNTYSNLSSFSYIFSYSLAITTERFASIYEDHLTGQGLNKTRYNLLLKGNP